MISPADNSAGRPRPISPSLAPTPPSERDAERREGMATLDAEVRALRDKVFGILTTHNNWLYCREYWLTPANIAWLREHTGKTA
jgi:hypothetical protein